MIVDIVSENLSGKGGTETALYLLSNGLVKRGHQVRIFFREIPRYLEFTLTIPEVYYYILPPKAATWEAYATQYAKLLKHMNKPDIVLATMLTSQCYICKLALNQIGLTKVPVLSWIHISPELTQDSWTLNYADGHLAISNSMKQLIHKHVPTHDIHMVGNPIVLPSSKHQIKSVNNPLRIVYVGRLDNYCKRIDLIFRALTILSFPFELLIYGSGYDEIYLKSLVSYMHLESVVHFKGWLEEPWDDIHSATALVLPSKYESFGLVVAEALARGLPVIVSKGTAASDLVIEGVNGWHFAQEDYINLATILTNIYQGVYLLPSYDSCRQSVQAYEASHVINRIEKILLEKIQK